MLKIKKICIFASIIGATLLGAVEYSAAVIVYQDKNKNDWTGLISQAVMAASGAYNNPKLSDRQIMEGETFSDYNNPEGFEEDGIFASKVILDVGNKARAELKEQFDEFSKFTYTVDQQQKPAGIIYYKKGQDNQNDQILVAFHGTENVSDIMTDLKASKIKATLHGSVNGSRVHSGFYQRYSQGRNDFLDLLNQYIHQAQTRNKAVDILVTGHSLGGALASLAAIDLIGDIKGKNLEATAKVKLITFNSPRVFDNDSAEKVNEILGDNALRLWRKGDPVSAVPMGSLGYKHVGKSLKMSQIYEGTNLASNHSLDLMKNDALSVKKFFPVPEVIQEAFPIYLYCYDGERLLNVNNTPYMVTLSRMPTWESMFANAYTLSAEDYDKLTVMCENIMGKGNMVNVRIAEPGLTLKGAIFTKKGYPVKKNN
ncbi:lipase family protein [Cysteiniphilum sp. JM-1]|uniref:lipase family protein n=1 Tax=Cysteiniphilum sp. JM-1 TaxID=2610891 RepID=UPI0012451232|nr:lipase family protein [Cysteiniphilum sp. JM-1]